MMCRQTAAEVWEDYTAEHGRRVLESAIHPVICFANIRKGALASAASSFRIGTVCNSLTCQI